MAKSSRDYAAEYARRVARGKKSGLTKQQARRGAKKFAGKPVSEAAERKKRMATPKPVKGAMGSKGGWERREYTTLKEAQEAASRLNPFSPSYIIGKGRLSATSGTDRAGKNETGEHEWRPVSSSALPDDYDASAYQAMQERTGQLFTAKPSRFAVMYRQPGA